MARTDSNHLFDRMFPSLQPSCRASCFAHGRVPYLRLPYHQDHDAFCDAAHLDRVVLPVSGLTHPDTGAERIIFPGRITVTLFSFLIIWSPLNSCFIVILTNS